MKNRTLGVMDNLEFIRALNNECIDLIAIDPPFAANETFTSRPRIAITDAEIDEERQLAARHGVPHDEGRLTNVHDIWTWDSDIHPDWMNRIEDDYPPVYKVIQAVEACATENEAAYIAFMAVRLIECRRVLKSTGSIYVHCDDHANGYLRLLMDAVFGSDNFRNEITWRRSVSHNDAHRYGRITDQILYYIKSDLATWNGPDIRTPKSEAEIKSAFRSKDERGRFRSDNLTGPSHDIESGSPSTVPWRNYDVLAMNRVWSVPKTGNYAEYIERNFIPGYRSIEGIHDRLDALDAAGLIYHPPKGRWPGLKRYADADQGVSPQNLISRPTGFTNYSASGGEFTGYTTQKPLELYERLIEASTHQGEVVMDIFAGCATTAIAAENLGRHWIACDIAYRSWTMLKRRFALNGIALSDTSSSTIDALTGMQPALSTAESFTLGPDDLPDRDDEDPEPFHNLTEVKASKRRTARSASWSGRIPRDEAKRLLINEFGPSCWGCGWQAPQFPNGEYDLGLLEVDHIWAKQDPNTGNGGSDELYNLALLHATCNRRKGNRLTLEELRQQNAGDGRIYGEPSDLVHLGRAIQFANEHILRRETSASRI